MGNQSKLLTSEDSDNDNESGDAFTDGDFDVSDDEVLADFNNDTKCSQIPVNETVNEEVKDIVDTDMNGHEYGSSNGIGGHSKVNGYQNGDESDSIGENDSPRSTIGDQSPSIVGILGNQQNYAEQRLAARRAARAEARDIRMRELERQQREQENHADKAYDMYSGPRLSSPAETALRRGGARLAALGATHSPRRGSEDADDALGGKDLRHELKEVEEKCRKAMILQAQLDNEKAALGYQLELMKDRLEEALQEYAQLQREHKEKCSAHERLKREHASLERELAGARAGLGARDAAARDAGFVFVDAQPAPPRDAAPAPAGPAPGPLLALVSLQGEQLLNEAGEGTLDVRLAALASSRSALEAEVRRLKLQLHDERAARHNGLGAERDAESEAELEALRKALTEAKARAARAEAEAALQAAGMARLQAQADRLRARHGACEDSEEQLKAERRRLQREAREALNRVEELETENSHLTKRLDKLKNAKSALLKEL